MCRSQHCNFSDSLNKAYGMRVLKSIHSTHNGVHGALIHTDNSKGIL
jgi:hypothetical protein